jgi:hypothetical protein
MNTLKMMEIKLEDNMKTCDKEDINNKKVIPQNIQRAIDKYLKELEELEENFFYEPKTIRLNSRAEFDIIKHSKDYIEFVSGYDIGNEELSRQRSLQYMHNFPIMLEHQRRKNKEVFFAPETLIKVDINDKPKKINVYVDDFLFDSIDVMWAHIANNLYKIRPKTNIDPSLIYVDLDYLFEDETPTDRIKIMIEYENRKEYISINDIVIIRYNV